MITITLTENEQLLLLSLIMSLRDSINEELECGKVKSLDETVENLTILQQLDYMVDKLGGVLVC